MKNGILKKVLFIGSILGALLASTANANLIVNGGFEEFGTASGGPGSWSYYLPTNVDGWEDSDSNIELWGTLGFESYEGSYHAELNAHGKNKGPWSISQTFATTAGQSYDLSFAYRARLGGKKNSKEAFNVDVGDFNFDVTDHVRGSWSLFSSSFIATDDFSTLTFTSVAQHRWTYGNFLDDIKVTSVPEPGSIALLALGLVGLGFARKQAR